MIRSFRILGCVLAIGMMAVSASANKVNVDLLVNPFSNTWDLVVTTKGANDGIAGYSIELLGSTETNHLQVGAAVGDNYVSGMTLWNSDNDVLFGGQNSVDAQTVIYGMGSPNFAVPAPIAGENRNMPPVGSPFGPLLLAHGRGSDAQIGEASVNVWTSGQADAGGVDARRAQVNISIIKVPEPATFALFGMALAGLTVLRKRG